MDYIRDFTKLDKDDITLAGSKGASLAGSKMSTVSLSDRIAEFLKRRSTLTIFVRPYSLTMILALYDAYKYKYKDETGEEIVDVSIYAYQKDGVVFYEFTVDFNECNRKIQKKINQGYPLAHKGIDLYYSRINEFRKLANARNRDRVEAARVFDRASRILAFESLLFKIPYMNSDLNMEIRDKVLLEKAIKARLDTEKFFVPGGELDTFLGSLKYIPPYLKNFRAGIGEFLVFDNEFIYDTEAINRYKAVIKAKQGIQEKVSKIKGKPAYPGKVTSIARLVLSREEFHKVNKGDIIVAHTTTPDYLPVIKKASGIITDEGGILSHASIVSREFKIPCIVGTYISTKVIKDGARITLDADTGTVLIHQ